LQDSDSLNAPTQDFDEIFKVVEEETFDLQLKLGAPTQPPIKEQPSHDQPPITESYGQPPIKEQSPYEEPPYEEEPYEEPLNEESPPPPPQFEDSKVRGASFVWGVKPSRAVDPYGKYGRDVPQQGSTEPNKMDSVNDEQLLEEYEETTIEVKPEQQFETIENKNKRKEFIEDTSDQDEEQFIEDEQISESTKQQFNHRTEELHVVPVQVAQFPTSESPMTQSDEPLFDQFDELEDFLADLAGEMGVYENL